MDIKNTNITSPSIDNLNNIQSYTIDNQKTSEIIDQNRISHGDLIFEENNQQLRNIAPFETNGKKTEFITTHNYFGPESNVDDDTTGSVVVGELNAKNETCYGNEHNIDIGIPDELVAAHGIHFENQNFLKTVDEEECDAQKDMDVPDHREYSFDSDDFDNVQKVTAEVPSLDSVKLMTADYGLPTLVPEKIVGEYKTIQYFQISFDVFVRMTK